jgi:uncharacterized DUF497 family protein
MHYFRRTVRMRIDDFEWDEGNLVHIELHHGVTPGETEEVFAIRPAYRKTKRGHYAAFGPTMAGRCLVVIFELKPHRLARVITGWDMSDAERRYYRTRQGGKP